MDCLEIISLKEELVHLQTHPIKIKIHDGLQEYIRIFKASPPHMILMLCMNC